MRNTTQSLLVLIVLFLTSCFSDEDVVPIELAEKTGKVLFKIKEEPMKLKELTNARTSNQKDELNLYELIFMQDGEVVKVFKFPDYHHVEDTIEMPVGIYEATLKEYFLEGRYKGQIKRESPPSYLDIKVDRTLRDPLYMHAQYMYINVSFDNLPGAIAWAGEEGFEPTDDDLLDTSNNLNSDVLMVDTENFEVVVEFEGERKRYTTAFLTGFEYFITIAREEEEPVETGIYPIEIITGDIIGQSFTWKWED